MLMSLAGDLRDTAPARSHARGVALLERLLTDGDSPLFVETVDESSTAALRHARSALLLALMRRPIALRS